MFGKRKAKDLIAYRLFLYDEKDEKHFSGNMRHPSESIDFLINLNDTEKILENKILGIPKVGEILSFNSKGPGETYIVKKVNKIFHIEWLNDRIVGARGGFPVIHAYKVYEDKQP